MKSIKQNLLRGALGLVLASVAACSGTKAGDSPQTESVQGEGSALHEVDSFDLSTGARLTIEADNSGDTLIVAVDMAHGTEDATNELIGGLSGLDQMYAKLAPGRAMPEAVVRTLAKRASAAALEPVGLEATAPGLSAVRTLDVDGAVDTLGRFDKEAPRNVEWFTNSYCLPDKISESNIASNAWYRKNDYCMTQRTNDMSRTVSDVRQGYLSVYLYRGNATVKASTQAVGAASWTLLSSTSLTEGGTKAFWVTLSSRMNIKFELADASDDGYNYAIHSAKANYGEKATSGQDYYHVLCLCTETQTNSSAVVTDPYVIEICSSNASEAAVESMADWQCEGQWERYVQSQRDSRITVTCVNKNQERVTSGKNCGASLEQTKRECLWASPNACTYSCTSSCQ